MIDPRKFTAAVAAAVLTCLSVFSCGDKKKDSEEEVKKQAYPEVKVTFLNVGKADAMVIRSQNSTVIIDCGEKGDGKEIVSMLENEGVSSVDYLILTHYDKDHVGGAAKVINKREVKNILAPDYDKSSEEMEKYNKAITEHNITPQLLTSDYSFTLDDVNYTVSAPEQTFYGEENENDFSLITKMQYHDMTFLFTGDAMEQRLEEVMDIGKCNLLKVPYHGRNIDNLGEFLDNTDPDCAIVCTSADEFSSKTKKLLNDKDITTYATCFNGKIIASTDGTDISIDSEK